MTVSLVWLCGLVLSVAEDKTRVRRTGEGRRVVKKVLEKKVLEIEALVTSARVEGDQGARSVFFFSVKEWATPSRSPSECRVTIWRRSAMRGRIRRQPTHARPSTTIFSCRVNHPLKRLESLHEISPQSPCQG